jgi:hypothetical protein
MLLLLLLLSPWTTTYTAAFKTNDRQPHPSTVVHNLVAHHGQGYDIILPPADRQLLRQVPPWAALSAACAPQGSTAAQMPWDPPLHT